MNKKIAPLQLNEDISTDFVPVTAFMKYMSEANALPYASTLSAEPFYNRLKSLAGGTCQYTSEAINPILDKAKKHLKENYYDFDLENVKDEELQYMMGMLFPSMFLEDKMSFMAPPFRTQFRFQSPATQEFFGSEDWEIKVDLAAHNEKMISTTIKAGAFLLEKFYDIKLDEFHSMVITMRNMKTGLEKHFKAELKKEFIDNPTYRP